MFLTTYNSCNLLWVLSACFKSYLFRASCIIGEVLVFYKKQKEMEVLAVSIVQFY